MDSVSPRQAAVAEATPIAEEETAAILMELKPRRPERPVYFVEELLERHPSIRYVPDRRMVVERGVATTTGITARCRWH